MAQDLITYARKLLEVLPPESAWEGIRERNAIQDKICCWYCGVPKDLKDLLENSVLPICNQCVIELSRKVDALRLVTARSGSGFKKELAKLQETSSPQFVGEIDKMMSALNKNGRSLGEEVSRLYHEASGGNLTEDELAAGGIPDIKTAQRLISDMMRAVLERDKQLAGDNPFADLTPEELLGTALQAVADEMVSDPEFCRRALEVFLFRVHNLVDVLMEVAQQSEAPRLEMA